MAGRSKTLTNGWRWGTCQTRKDHLVARTLFLLAREEDGSFIYGSENGHHAMVVLNDQQFLAYLLWSDDRGESSGKREPVLRQLFVRKEFRREGIGTAMVQTWADQFAFPIDVDGLFGVEDPNNDAQRILVKLGYAHPEGQTLVGDRCYFGRRPEQLLQAGTIAG
jgi:GNAT superfamily N-acetyltransferase